MCVDLLCSHEERRIMPFFGLVMLYNARNAPGGV